MCESLERVAGIEPASSAWKAAALPLSFPRLPQALSDFAPTRGGGSRTRTYEAITAADLQSAPFATRDIPPRVRNRLGAWRESFRRGPNGMLRAPADGPQPVLPSR